MSDVLDIISCYYDYTILHKMLNMNFIAHWAWILNQLNVNMSSETIRPHISTVLLCQDLLCKMKKKVHSSYVQRGFLSYLTIYRIHGLSCFSLSRKKCSNLLLRGQFPEQRPKIIQQSWSLIVVYFHKGRCILVCCLSFSADIFLSL